MTRMSDRMPEDVARRLSAAPLIERCSCPYEWRSYGFLYGISMGEGLVRMSTDAACKRHSGEGPGQEPA